VTLSTLERTHLDSIVNDNYRILEVIEACGRETADAADATIGEDQFPCTGSQGFAEHDTHPSPLPHKL
jgi:hypothetical protein